MLRHSLKSKARWRAWAFGFYAVSVLQGARSAEVAAAHAIVASANMRIAQLERGVRAPAIGGAAPKAAEENPPAGAMGLTITPVGPPSNAGAPSPIAAPVTKPPPALPPKTKEPIRVALRGTAPEPATGRAPNRRSKWLN